MSFSLFRKRISIGQMKLSQIVRTVSLLILTKYYILFNQVQGSNNPTIIPQLGEVDIKKTDLYKNTDSIINAQALLKSSSFSHLTIRNLPERVNFEKNIMISQYFFI